MTEDIIWYIYIKKTRNLKIPEMNYEFNFASRKFTLSTFLHTKHRYSRNIQIQTLFLSEQMLQCLKCDFHFFTPYLFRKRYEISVSNINSIKVKYHLPATKVKQVCLRACECARFNTSKTEYWYVRNDKARSSKWRSESGQKEHYIQLASERMSDCNK